VSAEWSTERVAEQFRLEVRQAFERENAAYRAAEATEIEQVKADPRHAANLLAQDPSYAAAMIVHDSLFWEIYSGADIQIVNNSVKVILPSCGFAIYPDLIEMFDGTSVGWSKTGIGAKIVNGEARVVAELILVDYWDDDRAAAWLAKGAACA
jgi:hypothetical protein